MTQDYPTAQIPGRVFDARLHLLDRQVVDVDGAPVCVVDDLSVSGIPADGVVQPDAERPVVAAVLSGNAIPTRIFGGRMPGGRYNSIPWSDVGEVDVSIRLRIDGSDLDALWIERWARRHVIGRIPGGRHDPQ